MVLSPGYLPLTALAWPLLPTHQTVPVIQDLCRPSTKTPLCFWNRRPGARFPSLSPRRRVSGLQGELLCALPGPGPCGGLQETALGTPSQRKVGSEMPVRPFPKEGSLGTLLAFICHELSPASQECYSSCWQTTGPGWGEAALMFLFSEIEAAYLPSLLLPASQSQLRGCTRHPS